MNNGTLICMLPPPHPVYSIEMLLCVVFSEQIHRFYSMHVSPPPPVYSTEMLLCVVFSEQIHRFYSMHVSPPPPVYSTEMLLCVVFSEQIHRFYSMHVSPPPQFIALRCCCVLCFQSRFIGSTRCMSPPPVYSTEMLLCVVFSEQIHRFYSMHVPPPPPPPVYSTEMLLCVVFSEQIHRFYSMPYAPLGFWSRLITRLVVFSHSNITEVRLTLGFYLFILWLVLLHYFQMLNL